MSSIEFGIHFTDRRVQSASESVDESFSYRVFDIDERWDERIEMFPEFAPIIEKVRVIVRRRQAKFTPENFENEGKRHLDVSHFLHEQTGVLHMFPTEIILNRAFGDVIPNELDEDSKARIIDVATQVVTESKGLAQSTENRSIARFIGLILKGEIGIDFEADNRDPAPGQIEFGLI